MANRGKKPTAPERRREARTPIQVAGDVFTWTAEHLSWVPSAVGGVATVGAAFSFAMVGDPPDISVFALVSGLVCTVISVTITVFMEVWRRQSRAGERGEALRTHLLLGDALDPILDEIACMPGKPKGSRETALAKIVSNASATFTLTLPSAKSLRVIVYRIDEQNGVRSLKSMNHVGRKDKPGKLEDKEGERGSAIFKMIESGTPLFVADTSQSQQPGVISTGKRYKTFIASPIIAGEKAYGMISIDSPVVGSLDENDMPVVETIAGMLAIAFAIAER